VQIEKLLDLSGLYGNAPVPRDRPGQLLEAGVGVADELHQDKNRDFRWKLCCRQAFEALPLEGCNIGIYGKVDVRVPDLPALESALSA
jgi:hypothetical protein